MKPKGKLPTRIKKGCDTPIVLDKLNSRRKRITQKTNIR